MVIDTTILGLYMLIEGVRGQLEVKRVMNRENPEDIIGVSEFLRRIDLLLNVALINPRGYLVCFDGDVSFHNHSTCYAIWPLFSQLLKSTGTICMSASLMVEWLCLLSSMATRDCCKSLP